MKRTLAFALALVLCLPLVGCGSAEREAVESEILAIREENLAKEEGFAEEAEAAEAPSAGDAGTTSAGNGAAGSSGSGTAAETEQTGAEKPGKPAHGNDWEGILSSEYQLVGNKYYYECGTKKNGETVRTLMYYDLVTLENDVICPDPLCKHDNPSICKYISIDSKTSFVFENEHILYWVRFLNSQASIWQYDLLNNNAKKIASTERTEPQLIGAENGILYYCDNKSDLENGHTVYRQFLLGVDTSTGETIYESLLKEGMNPLFIQDDIVWINWINAIVTLDIDSDELKKVCEYPGGLRTWYYDTHDNSFWFNAIDQERFKGSIWVWKGGIVEQVNVPAEEIYYFQLTKTKLFYSPYDPIKLGEGPAPSWEVFDYSGGKVYETDRARPEAGGSLIYNAEEQYVICMSGVFGYCVFDNHLYFSLFTIARSQRDGREIVGLMLSDDNPMLRINLVTGEKEELKFE